MAKTENRGNLKGGVRNELCFPGKIPFEKK